MSGISIHVDDSQLRTIVTRLAGLAEAPVDNDLLDGIGVLMVDAARRRINETKRSPGGEPWVIWSDAYQEASKGVPHHGILHRRGYLFGSLQHVVGANSVEAGSNLEYARIHQLGGETGRGGSAKMPPRPYLGFGADDLEDIRDAVHAYYGAKIGALS